MGKSQYLQLRELRCSSLTPHQVAILTQCVWNHSHSPIENQFKTESNTCHESIRLPPFHMTTNVLHHMNHIDEIDYDYQGYMATNY